MNDDFKNKILETIEQKNIEPTARWKFVVREYGKWGGALLSLIVGSMFGGLALYAIANSDVTIADESGISLVVMFAVMLWLVALTVMITVAAFNIEYTKRGYRYPLYALIVALIITSFGFGGALFAAGYGKSFDETIANVIPLYKSVEERRQKFWFAPDEGRLIGKITSINEPHTIVIDDHKGNVWHVHVPHHKIPQHREHIVEHQPMVAVIGIQTEDFEFEACRVIPWSIHGSKPVWRNGAEMTNRERIHFEKRIKQKCKRLHRILKSEQNQQ